MTIKDKRQFLLELANNPELLEIARAVVEDALVEWRERPLSQVGRNNGLVCKEADGTPSSLIRFGTEHALKIGLLAIAASLDEPAYCWSFFDLFPSSNG